MNPTFYPIRQDSPAFIDLMNSSMLSNEDYDNEEDILRRVLEESRLSYEQKMN